MTAKTNFKKQMKQDKKRKARAQRNAQAKHRERQRKAALPVSEKYSEEFIRKYIDEHGLARAVADLKLRSNGDGMTARDIMETIHNAIPQVIGVHSGLEIVDSLAQEGTVTVSDEERATMVEFDQLAVRFTEDTDAIIAFIEAKQEPEEYSELVLDLTTCLSDMFLTLNDPVMAILESRKDQVEEFAKEHRSEGQTIDQQMQELHIQRMVRIAPLYRTQQPVGEETLGAEEEAVRHFPDDAEAASAELIKA